MKNDSLSRDIVVLHERAVHIGPLNILNTDNFDDFITVSFLTPLCMAVTEMRKVHPSTIRTH